MAAHGFWWLAVDGLAVFRLAVLVTKDTIMRPLRLLLERPFASRQLRDAQAHKPTEVPRGWRWYLAELASCPWCVSVWLAAGVVALTESVPVVWQYPAMALAFSGVAGYLAERS